MSKDNDDITLDWSELPVCDECILPSEYSEGGGWCEYTTATAIDGIRCAVIQAGRCFHPAHIALLDELGRPLCYLPCNPDVCPRDDKNESVAFFDDGVGIIGHLIFRTREFRTYARAEFECVTALDTTIADGTATIVTHDLRTVDSGGGIVRNIRSMSGSKATISYRCNACNYGGSAPYGGFLPEYATFKHVGCSSCKSIVQAAIDVRDAGIPVCECGAKAHLYDDNHCRWVYLQEQGRYEERYRCPSCDNDELMIDGVS